MRIPLRKALKPLTMALMLGAPALASADDLKIGALYPLSGAGAISGTPAM